MGTYYLQIICEGIYKFLFKVFLKKIFSLFFTFLMVRAFLIFSFYLPFHILNMSLRNKENLKWFIVFAKLSSFFTELWAGVLRYIYFFVCTLFLFFLFVHYFIAYGYELCLYCLFFHQIIEETCGIFLVCFVHYFIIYGYEPCTVFSLNNQTDGGHSPR